MRPALLFATVAAACLMTFAAASTTDYNETAVPAANFTAEPETNPDFTFIRFDEISQQMSVREYFYNDSVVSVWSLDCNMTNNECNETNYSFDPFGLGWTLNEINCQKDFNTTDECNLDEYPEEYTRNESDNGGHAYLNSTEA
jgi:hypothetical protein